MRFGHHNRFEPHTQQRRTTKSAGTLHWVATIALSAIIGSGSTLAGLPYLAAKYPNTVHALAARAGLAAAGGEAASQAGSITTNDSNTNGPAAEAAMAPTEPATPVNVSVNDGIIGAVKKVEPAVMGVVNYSTMSDFFTQQTKLEATGIGTGVLFHKDSKYGYVVTNNHVVEAANRVQVVLGSGHHVQATVMGTDPYTDLAVLRVPVATVRSIQPATFADSDTIEVGEPAIAIGTPMGLDFADTVTAGIVSAKKRTMPVEEPETNTVLDYQAVIQTDAAINPGNSGGPLCDIDGKVIGINSSKIVAQNFEAMGFAIPSNEVVNIANQLMKQGHALHPSLGVSGYSLASLPDQMWPDVPVDYGVWVQTITSPETRLAGLHPQDVIVGINNHAIQTMADLRTYLFQEQAGQMVTLKVYRNQQALTIKVKLGTMETQNSTNMPSGSAGTGGAVDTFGSGSTGSGSMFGLP